MPFSCHTTWLLFNGSKLKGTKISSYLKPFVRLHVCSNVMFVTCAQITITAVSHWTVARVGSECVCTDTLLVTVVIVFSTFIKVFP